MIIELGPRYRLRSDPQKWNFEALTDDRIWATMETASGLKKALGVWVEQAVRDLPDDLPFAELKRQVRFLRKIHCQLQDMFL